MQVPEAVIEGDGGLGPKAFDKLKGVFKAGDAVAGIEAEGGVFFFVAADANAEDQPASGQLVKAGGNLGEVDGVLEGRNEDGYPEPDPFSDGGGIGEEGEGVEGVHGAEDGVLGPDAVIAEGLDEGQVLRDEAHVDGAVGEHLGDGYADPSLLASNKHGGGPPVGCRGVLYRMEG